MGRLIDADELLKAMDSWDKFGYSARYGLERLDKDDKDFIPYVHYGDMLKAVKGMPTVEAIPKDRYEARLKADMVAMLEEIQLELDEMKITKVRSAGFAPYSKDPFRRGVNCSKEIIQDKINALKGE